MWMSKGQKKHQECFEIGNWVDVEASGQKKN